MGADGINKKAAPHRRRLVPSLSEMNLAIPLFEHDLFRKPVSTFRDHVRD